MKNEGCAADATTLTKVRMITFSEGRKEGRKEVKEGRKEGSEESEVKEERKKGR